MPGWDTHGLPIELKAMQSVGDAAAAPPLKIRAKCRDFALKTVDAQREGFKRMGVWGDWDAPYITLEPSYEAAQLRVFGKMFLDGHIYRCGLNHDGWRGRGQRLEGANGRDGKMDDNIDDESPPTLHLSYQPHQQRGL